MSKTILFLGTHGQHNLGDELLLETFLAQLGRAHRYFVNSYDPEFTTGQLAGAYNAHVFHTGQSKTRLVRLILESDLLFFGGGSIIKELYESVGRNRYATLLMVLSIVTFSRWLARKPVIISNIGVGPLRSRPGRWIAGLILRQADFVSVRDQASYKTCVALGLKPGKLACVPDAVFVHSPSDWGVASQPGGPQADDRLRIALNLNYTIENPGNWDYFVKNLAKSLEWVAARHPLEIHALPMQSGFKAHHDLEELQAFAKRLPFARVVMHDPQNAADVVRVIASSDLVLAERLHALIIAAILGRPSLALIYDVKVRELVRTLCMDDYAVDINVRFDPQALTEKLLALDQQREMVSAQLSERSAALRQEVVAYFERLRSQFAAK